MKTTTPHSFTNVSRRVGGSARSSLFPLPSSLFSSAFSIVEVMFAVMILGIGFILVAAMFPVAIQQSQATVDEVTARSVSLNGAYQLAATMHALTTAEKVLLGPVVPWRHVLPAPAYLSQTYDGLRCTTETPRYSWRAAYSSDGVNTLNMVVVGIKATTVSQFEAPPMMDFIPATGVTTTTVPGSPSQVTLPPSATAAGVEGAVLINQATGVVYYLGNQVDGTTNMWEVRKDRASDADPPATFDAFLLGRSLRDPTQVYNAVTNPYEGACMVVAVQRIAMAL